MQNAISTLLSKFLSKIAVVALISTTAISGGAAGIKLMSKPVPVSAKQAAPVQPAELREVSEDAGSTPAAKTARIQTRSATGPSSALRPQLTVAGPSGAGTPTPAAQGCIITLFGKQYDVTRLQTTHPGGNVFVCGTDQSAAYQAQHGTDMSRMAPYLVSGTSGTSGATGISGPTGSLIGSREDDHDAEEDGLKEQEHATGETSTGTGRQDD
jgi:hypothetical protein